MATVDQGVVTVQDGDCCTDDAGVVGKSESDTRSLFRECLLLLVIQYLG